MNDTKIEWNPTGDVWKPATVLARWSGDPDVGEILRIRLDENGEHLTVASRHTRPVPA